ncbi:hypothetical protein GCM10007940_12600 [Portibacter lacus]|uniref:Cytochrome c domain-containing protein n=2 Tax=Portibacter lacus TaxID=1099794 RepID=A0AA37SMG9_9BACT|nr:hypothetical protein GCM10007940_12600 [Portibacter lacus]
MASCVQQDLPKDVDLSSYQLIDTSLQLTAIASEPMIYAPVAIDFDSKGRLWVAEMPDYMPDINGEKENIPNGRILILEDSDEDGIMDKSTVFKDKIHHLRAIRLYNGGILYADDPNLYYSDIINDQEGATTIIDSFYAVGGNVEHKPNGLLLNIDNCFYNAKSHYRYCYDGENWTKESTNFRGQWGITNDENGRLYANDNSNFLYGDQFLPNTLISNKYIHKPQGLNKDVVRDRSIFPIHATSINRGYNEGTLDAEGKVLAATSACGPLIFQSIGLGESYDGDAFICVPEGNLIKRLKIQQNAFFPKATFAYPQKEFLVSDDEAFRPVNINTGPDGNLYIVDMHRGIIQHKIYMTNYLKEEIQQKKLDEIVDYGRILKISKKGSSQKMPTFDFSNEDSLLQYLSMDNGWLRTKAQEKLRFLASNTIDHKLYELLQTGSKLSKLHALWILDARKNIDLEKINKIKFSDPWVIANLFKIVGQKNIDLKKEAIVQLYENYISLPEEVVVNHMLTSLDILYNDYPEQHQRFLKALEEGMEDAKIAAYPSGTLIENPSERATIYNERVSKRDSFYIFKKQSKRKASQDGYSLFNNYCSPCHGFGGEGMEGQAPSLVGSTLINNQPEIIPLIIQHGLTGPVTINGKEENFPSVMPSFNINAAEIEKISNYIYNAFSNEVRSVNRNKIKLLQDKFSDRKKMWTEEELLRTDFETKR